MAMSNQNLAPSLKGLPFLGRLFSFKKDVLAELTCAQRSLGPVIRYKMGPFTIHQLNGVDSVNYVLKNTDQYDKKTHSSKILKAVTGDSILVSHSDKWEKHRRMMRPPFSRPELSNYVASMTDIVEGVMKEWESLGSEMSVNIASEMMKLTYRVIEQTLFGTRPEGSLRTLELAMADINSITYKRLARGVNLPLWVPSPENRKYVRAIAKIDKRINEIVEESDPNRQCLFTKLQQTNDTETNKKLTAQELRDEAVTLLVAGHETTANALTAVFYLLSEHPSILERLHIEVDQVLEGRIIKADDLSKLTLSCNVILESMRLYPPIWAMIRNSVEDDEIEGYSIPKGSSIVISPYVIHRMEEYWEEPEKFDPDRFEKSRHKSVPQGAYLPFGLGKRTCIGQNFAMIEATVILVTILQKFTISSLGETIEMDAGIVLKIKGGLSLKLGKRLPF